MRCVWTTYSSSGLFLVVVEVWCGRSLNLRTFIIWMINSLTIWESLLLIMLWVYSGENEYLSLRWDSNPTPPIFRSVPRITEPTTGSYKAKLCTFFIYDACPVTLRVLLRSSVSNASPYAPWTSDKSKMVITFIMFHFRSNHFSSPTVILMQWLVLAQHLSNFTPLGKSALLVVTLFCLSLGKRVLLAASFLAHVPDL